MAISRSSASKRWLPLAGLLLIVVVPVLAGCDPMPVPHQRDEANVVVHVGNNGAAEARLMLPSVLTRSELERVAADARGALFSPRAEPNVRIDENGGGSPFVVIEAPHAYQPGPTPEFAFDANRLQSVLRAEGLSNVNLSYCGPLVPFEVKASPEPDSDDGRCSVWHDISKRAPTARITMHPSPAKFWTEVRWLTLALFVDAAALVLVLRTTVWTARRRFMTALLGTAVLGICAIAVSSVETVQADNLGVRGQLSGPFLSLAKVTPALVLPLGVGAVTLTSLAVFAGRPRRAAVGDPVADDTANDPWRRQDDRRGAVTAIARRFRR